MKNIPLILATVLVLVSCSTKKTSESQTLKDALAGKFYIGTAMNLDQIYGRDTAGVRVIKQQFNAIVAENCMKSMHIEPEQGKFTFADADKFVEFGEKNGMFITGHCLVWHNQAPAWFFTDKNGADVSRDTLLARMKTYITTVVSRYKGKVKGWDVLNEALNDDGTWRDTKFYTIIGKDFVDSAFVWAAAADPAAELYYNDFGLAQQPKRAAVVELIKHLKNKGIRIDAIGMQGHCGLNYPDFAEATKSAEAFAAEGVKVMITELDQSVLPHPNKNQGAEITDTFAYKKAMNPFPDGLPTNIDSLWTARYVEMFRIFLQHKNIITRVTTWGTSDKHTWRNNWPIPGRTDYPLLFDRNYQPKAVVGKIIALADSIIN